MFIALWLGACTARRPVPKLGPTATTVPTALSCADCPDQLIRVSPWRWPPFTAVHFFRGEQPLADTLFRVRRAPGDATLQDQLQFGSIYLLRGHNGVHTPLQSATITCIQGRDTMYLSFWVPRGQNIVYDSIPFRAGRYQLSKPFDPTAPYPVPVAYTSFAAYFQQHEAELAQANPFADCHFDYDPNREENPTRYVAATPADIFRLLLQHTHYEQ